MLCCIVGHQALYYYFSLLLTGVVGEAPVYHGHVLLLCGQNSAPCGQQLLAWRDSFNKSLMQDDRRERTGDETEDLVWEQIYDHMASRFLSHLQAVVTLQAVVGSHHHVPVLPLPGVVKVKDALFVQHLALLGSLLVNTHTQSTDCGKNLILSSDFSLQRTCIQKQVESTHLQILS